jgi:hypothetical protein
MPDLFKLNRLRLHIHLCRVGVHVGDMKKAIEVENSIFGDTRMPGHV